MYMFLVDISQC